MITNLLLSSLLLIFIFIGYKILLLRDVRLQIKLVSFIICLLMDDELRDKSKQNFLSAVRDFDADDAAKLAILAGKAIYYHVLYLTEDIKLGRLTEDANSILWDYKKSLTPGKIP